MAKKYVINGVEFVDDGDIDLEKEAIYYAKGERITNNYVEQIVEEIHRARGVGSHVLRA